MDSNTCSSLRKTLRAKGEPFFRRWNDGTVELRNGGILKMEWLGHTEQDSVEYSKTRLGTQFISKEHWKSLKRRTREIHIYVIDKIPSHGKIMG